MDRPHVSLCLATSLDGRISATPDGGPDFTSREDVQKLFRLRAASDALLIGAGTVRTEQVLPLVRNEALAEERMQAGKPPHPAAVIVSNSLDLPWDGRYFRYRKQRMFLLTGRADAHHYEKAGSRNLEILETGERLDLVEGLKRLYQLGFRQILAEGGGTLVANLLALDLVDTAYLTIAPVLIGGAQTPRLVADAPAFPMRRFTLSHQETIGDELHLIYRR